jgi:hypothetical protein
MGKRREAKMIHLENNNTELHYDQYVNKGGMMSYLRSALPLSDPDHLYNYLKNSSVLTEANLTPEHFGIYHPVVEKFKGKPEEELLSVITDLIIENEYLQRNQC